MADWNAFIQPEAVSLYAGLLMLLLEIAGGSERAFKFAAVLLSIAVLISTGMAMPVPVFGFSKLNVDSYTVAARFIIALLFVLIYLFLAGYDREITPGTGLFYALGFFALTGGLLMISAGDLVSLIIVLEISSIASYAMAAYRRTKEEIEAVTKYFLFGGLASAFYVIGLALLLFAAGSTGYETVAAALSAPQGVSPLFYTGLFLVLSAFAYKIAVFPWMLYAPDFYQGQNLAALTFNAVIPKAAGFAAVVAFLRLMPKPEPYIAFFTVLVFVSWFYSNLSALAEKNVLRIIAFSSIAHAAFIAAAALLPPGQMERTALVYILSYGVSTAALVGSIAVAGMSRGFKLEELSGRLAVNPLNEFLFLLAVVSLAGVPPLPIFFAKYYLLKELVEAGFTGIAVAGAVFSAVSLGYYLNLLKNGFLFEKRETKEQTTRSYPILAASLTVLMLLFYVAYLSGIFQLFPPA